MKYVFFTYNILTLCRSVKYSDTVFGKDNTYIVYSDLVSDLPAKIQQDYNIKFISSRKLDNGLSGLRLVVNTAINAINVWKEIDTILANSEDEFTLIFFRDNELQEATAIQKSQKKYGSRIHMWVMEEGAGLYASVRAEVRYKTIKKFIYKLFNVSEYSLEARPQGMHTKIEKVICTKPDEFLNKISDRHVILEKMIDIFTPDFNEYILDSIVGSNRKKRDFDFVFLTQPFRDFKEDFEKLNDIHQKLLPRVFHVLEKYGNTIIKLHPREHFDYTKYLSNNVRIVNELEKTIPFEILMHLYGNPRMISMYSSTSINIEVEKRSIYLGEMFEFPNMDKLFTKEFYKKNNIVSCKTIEEFEQEIIGG